MKNSAGAPASDPAADPEHTEQVQSPLPDSGHTGSSLERFRTLITSDSIGFNGSHSRFADENLLYVQAVGHHKCLKGYYCERKGLHSFLLIYTMHGEGKLLYHGQTFSLHENSCVLISCMDYHRYSTDTGWDFLYVHFDGARALPLYRLYEGQTYQPSFMDRSCSFDLSIYRIYSLMTGASYHREILIDRIMTGLLADLLISRNTEVIDPPHFISEIETYVAGHLAGRISLDSISEHVHLNKYYISHAFRKYLNTTIQEYIISARMSQAKSMLINTAYSVDQISGLCGMASASHFIRLFREREGMTPARFRRKWM